MLSSTYPLYINLQNHVDEAMEMYQEMHMWDEAIEVAEAKVMYLLIECFQEEEEILFFTEDFKMNELILDAPRAREFEEELLSVVDEHRARGGCRRSETFVVTC